MSGSVARAGNNLVKVSMAQWQQGQGSTRQILLDTAMLRLILFWRDHGGVQKRRGRGTTSKHTSFTAPVHVHTPHSCTHNFNNPVGHRTYESTVSIALYSHHPCGCFVHPASERTYMVMHCCCDIDVLAPHLSRTMECTVPYLPHLTYCAVHPFLRNDLAILHLGFALPIPH